MIRFRIIAAIFLFIFLSIVRPLSSYGNTSINQGSEAPQDLLKPATQSEDEIKNNPSALSYTVASAASEIKVDGILNEQAWTNAAVIKIPYEWWPGDNIPAPVETDCLVTYDDNNLYVAFRAYDPEPDKIRAHLMDRDATDTLIQDDHVVIIIDPFNDERRAFQFRVNPFGVQADANFSELEGYEDFSWDAIWKSVGRITEKGYAVEIAIPFNQLRFPHNLEKQTWGFIAERSYPRTVRHRMRSMPTDRNNACLLCQANKLTGFQGITPGHNLEFDPTLTSGQTNQREDFPAGTMEAGKIDVEPGLTTKWGITPNMIFNATLNPDFSQVEADVAQLDVNVRYALYYPEKRPFFLEGADFFLTPIEAVFTRTVANPYWGLKLTGKADKNAIGFFSTQDSVNNLILPSNQQSIPASLDQNVFSNVFRYRRDVGQASTMGVIYTGRTSEDYHNHVFGFDGFLRLSRANTMSFQYLHSDTAYPETFAQEYNQYNKPFGGTALKAELSHMSRNWYLSAGYDDRTPGFRADYGFVPRVDIRKITGTVLRRFWGKPDSRYTQMQFGMQTERVEDHKGNLTDQTLLLWGNYQGPLQSAAYFTGIFIKEFYNGVMYDLHGCETIFEIKPSSGLYFHFYSGIGDYIDYNNSRLAFIHLIEPSMEIGLGRHLNINLKHNLERLSFEGERIYLANLTQANIKYHFNVRTFVRAILQYLDVDRNSELYLNPVQPETNRLFTQFLFSYKINPQTVLFLGYSDNYLGLRNIDLTQTDRTFFVKIGYAFVL
jgi:hypothetical protein